MENHDIDHIILTSLQGEATANEIEILRQWLSEDEDHQNIFESVKLYWENSTLHISSEHTEKAYQKLMSLSTKDAGQKIIDINKTHNNSVSLWFKVAAALIVFFLLAGSAYFIINENQHVSQIITTTEIIKQNPKGQKLTTYLPDGSKVILNSLSEIRYSAPFVGSERIIELKGEAFFEVKKNADKPFKVISNGVITTALGTSFNVNGKNEDHVEVALVTGKVSVIDAQMNEVFLEPGKSAIANRNEKLKVQEFNYLDKVGWKDGVLAFNENSLSTIFSKLEDWYGVEFDIDKRNLGQFHYTGTYRNETLEEVLEGISFVHHFEYEISGDTVKIKFVK